jgi:hypothetical protein
MGSPKESLEQKNIFTEKYDEIRRLDGTVQTCTIPKMLNLACTFLPKALEKCSQQLQIKSGFLGFYLKPNRISTSHGLHPSRSPPILCTDGGLFKTDTQ